MGMRGRLTRGKIVRASSRVGCGVRGIKDDSQAFGKSHWKSR